MFDKLTLAAEEATEVATEAATKGEKLSIPDAAVTAVFGYAVVFFGLVILMIVLYCTGAYFKSRDAKAKAADEAAKKAAPAAPSAPAPAIEQKLAPGSAGHVKLFDVPDKEAAMIMAIVADKMQTPLNELHFISIKEVK
ncbi:MAG: OadG family protein [Ruminococcus sp.]|jgi:Na+-transporting methylmalonyl-CoA/oxaloacetate decarboxylase gamma subunit|nr:OadG family protein [Ruminococcus sp.]